MQRQHQSHRAESRRSKLERKRSTGPFITFREESSLSALIGGQRNNSELLDRGEGAMTTRDRRRRPPYLKCVVVRFQAIASLPDHQSAIVLSFSNFPCSCRPIGMSNKDDFEHFILCSKYMKCIDAFLRNKTLAFDGEVDEGEDDSRKILSLKPCKY